MNNYMEYHKCRLCFQTKVETKYSGRNMWSLNRIKTHRLFMKLINDNNELSSRDLSVYLDEYFVTNRGGNNAHRYNSGSKKTIMSLFECSRGAGNLFLLMYGCLYSPNSPLSILSEDVISLIWDRSYIRFYPLYIAIQVKTDRLIFQEMNCDKCTEDLAKKTQVLQRFVLGKNITDLLHSKKHKSSIKMLRDLEENYSLVY